MSELCPGPNTSNITYECNDKKFFKKYLDPVIRITTEILSFVDCAMVDIS